MSEKGLAEERVSRLGYHIFLERAVHSQCLVPCLQTSVTHGKHTPCPSAVETQPHRLPNRCLLVPLPKTPLHLRGRGIALLHRLLHPDIRAYPPPAPPCTAFGTFRSQLGLQGFPIALPRRDDHRGDITSAFRSVRSHGRCQSVGGSCDGFLLLSAAVLGFDQCL